MNSVYYKKLLFFVYIVKLNKIIKTYVIGFQNENILQHDQCLLILKLGVKIGNAFCQIYKNKSIQQQSWERPEQYMQLDTFEYPHNEELIQKHIDANRIGKNRLYLTKEVVPDFNRAWRKNADPMCNHCGRIISECPQFRALESEDELEKRYGIYGPNCVIYLGFIRRIAIFMFICTIVFAIPLTVLNASGDACQKNNYCLTNNWVYRWSVYNVIGVNSLLPQAWIWLAFCIAIIIFTIYLRIYTLSTYRRIVNRNTTDSNYSLILRRLPQQTTPQDIKNMMQRQISIIKQFRNQQTNYQPYVLNEMNQFVRASSPIKDIIMLYQSKQMMEDYEGQLQNFKLHIRYDQQDQFKFHKLVMPNKFANAAIVRFYDKQTSLNLAKSAQTPIFQKIINYLCVFYKPKSKYQIHDKQISVQSAPHPTDMLWNNLGYHQHSRILGKVLTTIVAFMILIVSSAFALALSYWIQLIINEKNRQPILLTIVVATVVFGFNKILRKKVMEMTRLYKLDNKTDQESQQIMLIVFHQSLNVGFFSVIAPILVKLPQAVAQKTMKSSSFPTVMLTTIIMQALLATILDYFFYYYELKPKFYRKLHEYKISMRTQSQAIHKFKGAEVPFVKCYAFNVKMVWFGFLYGVVSPISIFISFLGMLLCYFFEKKLFNERYSIPFYGRSRINYEMIDLLDYTPLLIGLFNIFLYKTSQRQREFSSEPSIMTLYITMVVIGVIHLLIPWSNIIRRINRTQQRPQMNYNYNRNHLQITYEQANPVTRPSMNILYRQNSILQKITAEHEQKMKIIESNQKENHKQNRRRISGQYRQGPAQFNLS